jgi:hypothetical protein
LRPFLLCLLYRLLLLCLLHLLLLLLLLGPARLTRLRYLLLLLELTAEWPPLLLQLLPHGLPEVLVELRQDGLEGARQVLLERLAYLVPGTRRLSCLFRAGAWCHRNNEPTAFSTSWWRT